MKAILVDYIPSRLPSGSAHQRNGNPFASEKPFVTSHAQRLALSRLRLPKDMEMIGGLHGRRPEMPDMRRLAQLLEAEWGERHCENKAYEEHFADIKLRFETISAPTFVAYGRAGWPDAVLFPIRTVRAPANEKEILGSDYWNTDSADGRIFEVRKSVSDSVFAEGLEKRLISEAFIPYARSLAGIGEISGAFFYTWHLNLTFRSKAHMREREMHLEIGAIPARNFLDGRIEEMSYSHLLL